MIFNVLPQRGIMKYMSQAINSILADRHQLLPQICKKINQGVPVIFQPHGAYLQTNNSELCLTVKIVNNKILQKLLPFVPPAQNFYNQALNYSTSVSAMLRADWSSHVT